MKNEVAKNIREFLVDNGYTFGSWGSCEHSVGMDYHCAKVRPMYSPVDGTYTIAVDPLQIKGWVCRPPYNYSSWELRWTISYGSKEELLGYLNDAIRPPTGCW